VPNYTLLCAQLPDTAASQKDVSLDEVAAGSQALLVLFICNHCPFVIAIIGGDVVHGMPVWVMRRQDSVLLPACGHFRVLINQR